MSRRRSATAILLLLVTTASLPAAAEETEPVAADESAPAGAPTAPAANEAHVPTPAQVAAEHPGETLPPTTDVPALATGASPDRRWGTLAAMGAIYVPLTVWSYFAWYHDKPDLPAFRYGGDGLFGENTYAGGADKLGHVYINHVLTLGTARLLRWGGWSPLASSGIGAGLSFGFFFLVEIKDGYYYEFSPGDLVANGVGALTAAAMVSFPRFDELLDFRLQYLPSELFRDELADGNVDIAEDYSGQTFLLALHLGVLPGVKGTTAGNWLRFLDLSLGYETRGYKPDPPAGTADDRSQRLFIGLSLNLQGVVDAALGGRTGAGGVVRNIGHGFFEVIQPPYSTLPVLESERSPDH